MKLRSGALVFLLSFLLLSLASFAARAVPAASVDAVQLPAWRVRGEVSEPLAPGMELQNGDQVRTGSGARVYLKFAEGSTVKLGESARMSFYSRSLKPASFFRGAIDMAVGAFRYTTAQAAKLRQRDVAIRVGTATIGIRGTDVWGKSGDDQDLVMLIEGRIEVKPAGGEPVEMSNPLSVFVAPKGAAPLPLSTATDTELKSRSQETDLEPSNGALHPAGRYALRLGEALDETSALSLYDQARAAGYPARIRPLRGESGWQYEVLVKGYASESEALRAAGPVGTALKVTATAARCPPLIGGGSATTSAEARRKRPGSCGAGDHDAAGVQQAHLQGYHLTLQAGPRAHAGQGVQPMGFRVHGCAQIVHGCPVELG